MQNKRRKDFLWILLFLTLTACQYKVKTLKEKKIIKDCVKEQMYRPIIHFSPQENWMNDPNGMFYYKGKYHLYFQYHPKSNVWGPMHWGHAISKDLINWEEQPIALYPDELGTIFSGSVVVDHNNTSGFGTPETPPIIAIYTNHDGAAEKEGSLFFQTQSLAYSLDEGQTWIKYNKNPVIKNSGIRDFRDPKVIWYEKEQKWILTLAAGQQTQFFVSNDLKEWRYLSSFGEGIGNHNGVWECPDLFKLPIKGTEETKWVHLVSINPGGPNGGSATQYFVGDFDGKQFVVDPLFESKMKRNHDFWIDFGKDNYAGVTFSNWKSAAAGVLFLGWMSNWEYANVVPTTLWRGTMTLGRELELFKTQQGEYRLRSIAPSNWDSYVTKTVKKEKRVVNKTTQLLAKNTIDLSAARIQITLSGMENTQVNFELANNKGDALVFGYDSKKDQFFIDRGQSGKTNFSENFSKTPSLAPRQSTEENLEIEIFLDKTSIELFFDKGTTVMTEIFFPNAPFETLTLRSSDSKIGLEHLVFQELKKQNK